MTLKMEKEQGGREGEEWKVSCSEAVHLKYMKCVCFIRINTNFFKNMITYEVNGL